MNFEKTLQKHTQEAAALYVDPKEFHTQVMAVADHLKEAFEKGHKVLVAGNGGSASIAMHLSDEMVGKYNEDRVPYPVIALTTDGAVITCIGNDYGYEEVFSRQVAALGKEGDVFVAMSTSGNSPNIVKAAETARDHGMTVIAFTGTQGKLKDMADLAITTPGENTARIQERDLHAVHLICEAFEPLHE